MRATVNPLIQVWSGESTDCGAKNQFGEVRGNEFLDAVENC